MWERSRIPTETVASYIRSPTLLISMRLGRVGINMSLAGKQATENIESTQLAQKKAYNRKPTVCSRVHVSTDA